MAHLLPLLKDMRKRHVHAGQIRIGQSRLSISRNSLPSAALNRQVFREGKMHSRGIRSYSLDLLEAPGRQLHVSSPKLVRVLRLLGR